MYALIINNTVSKYPYTYQTLCADNPNCSIPRPTSEEAWNVWGVYSVTPVTMPASSVAKVVYEGTPIFQDGEWRQNWLERDATQAEIDSNTFNLAQGITQATQARLDAFAQTRNYDGILSACTYVNSTNLTFQAEGEYCLQQRDATWAKLYEILAEAEAGARPIPTGYAEIESELPALVWPV